MKKMLSFLLVLSLLLCGCLSALAETPTLAGGWSLREDPTVTEEDKAAFDKAFEGFVGVGYEPFAVLGTQLVAGTNYCFACKATTVTAQPQVFYALVYIYLDLDGNAEITDIQRIAEDADGMTVGGWSVREDWTLTDADLNCIGKAFEGFVGAVYEPLAAVADQPVAGINHRYLCKGATVTLEPRTFYALITVYEDPEGTATLTDIVEIDPGTDSGNIEEAGQNPVLNIVGWYQDSVGQRATMFVDGGEGSSSVVTVDWSNSADETVEWVITGEYDADTRSIIGTCVKTVITTDESGEIVKAVEEYSNGTATLTVQDDDSILWQDDQEDAGRDCVFEWFDADIE